MNKFTLELVQNAVDRVYSNFSFRSAGSEQELDDIACFVNNILNKCELNLSNPSVIDKENYDIYTVKLWLNNNPIEITVNMTASNEELALSIFNQLNNYF